MVGPHCPGAWFPGGAFLYNQGPAWQRAQPGPGEGGSGMARKMNPAFAAAVSKEFKPSPELAAVIGDKPISRPQATKKIWEYFKKNKLNKGREITADEKLKPIFGKPKITMFEVGGILNQHLKS
jgi:chromatin remodeling complex protein RSC6